MPTDFLSVLKAFQDADVRYVLVGGLAVLLRGLESGRDAARLGIQGKRASGRAPVCGRRRARTLAK